MNRQKYRAVFLIVLLIPVGWIGASWYFDPVRGATSEYQQQAELPMDERAQIVGERDNVTVVTGMDSPFTRSKAMYAFAPNGTVLAYWNHTVFGDVDPSPVGEHTVMAATHDWYGQTKGCDSKCTRQYIERYNLSTGEYWRVHSAVTPKHSNSNWHDVDRLGKHRFLIGDIEGDSVYIVNTSTGVRPWGWHAQSAFPIDEAGPYPGDWAHLNDVEKLADGRVMISLRNQDQVVFVHPERGLQESWTLGCEDCHDTLYEQHNPDYIPAERGGPAILVADSENNRVIEYQRRNGSWHQSWVWTDPKMDWPRDADRLPNGHTLITDSHGKRLLEVNEAGDIVWQTTIINGYDAERLGTGDESAGGPSAVRAGLEGQGANTAAKGPSSGIANEQEWVKMGQIQKWWHGAQWLFPPWIELIDLVWGAAIGWILFAWAYVEYLWSGYHFQWPITSA